jgi:hypothetical protein
MPASSGSMKFFELADVAAKALAAIYIVVTRELGTLRSHPGLEVGDERSARRSDGTAVDLTLDVEDRIDALDRLDRQWRKHRQCCVATTRSRWLSVRNPARKQKEIAKATGYSPSQVSRILCSPEIAVSSASVRWHSMRRPRRIEPQRPPEFGASRRTSNSRTVQSCASLPSPQQINAQIYRRPSEIRLNLECGDRQYEVISPLERLMRR